MTEKDLFSLAAQKRSGAGEASGRKLKRSLSELNRRKGRSGAMYFECREGRDRDEEKGKSGSSGRLPRSENRRTAPIQAKKKAAHGSGAAGKCLLPICGHTSDAGAGSGGHFDIRR